MTCHVPRPQLVKLANNCGSLVRANTNGVYLQVATITNGAAAAQVNTMTDGRKAFNGCVCPFSFRFFFNTSYEAVLLV